MSEALVYRICSQEEWRAAREAGEVAPNADDRRDGFIHLSARDQLAETVRRHYGGRDDLLVLEIDAAALGDTLKWEPSRGGALFPHVHGPLPTSAVRAARTLAEALA
ncbi:MAG: DUF952 domain-containing protein [Caulobacterales bacterium]|nr:DUF952 domain-containing protein [Caulobacterales bacterium]